jgi:hypothetical protein
MSNLKAFMQPPVDTTKEIIVSERFKDEKGNVIPFKIRVISQEVNESLHKQASRPVHKNGVVVGSELDSTRYGNLLLIACTSYPNFKDAELCEYYKTKDATEVPARMLTIAEYNKLVQEIRSLNSFETNEDQIETLEEEAKN